MAEKTTGKAPSTKTSPKSTTTRKPSAPRKAPAKPADPKPNNVHQAVRLVMADLKPIPKDRENTQQRFMFRGIEDIYNQIHPLFVKHGIFIAPKLMNIENDTKTAASGAVALIRQVTVGFTVYGPDGSTIEAISCGEGADYGDKGLAKAMTAAQKTFLTQLFVIATEDVADPDDDQREKEELPTADPGPKTLTREQAAAANQEQTPQDQMDILIESLKTMVYNARQMKLVDDEKLDIILDNVKHYDNPGTISGFIKSVEAKFLDMMAGTKKQKLAILYKKIPADGVDTLDIF